MTSPIKTLNQVEREHIMSVLAHCKGNKTHAAKHLGITLKTLYNKLKTYETVVCPVILKMHEVKAN